MKASLEKLINKTGKDEYLMLIINDDWDIIEKHVFDTIVIDENMLEKPEPQSTNWLNVFYGGVVGIAIAYFGLHALKALIG